MKKKKKKKKMGKWFDQSIPLFEAVEWDGKVLGSREFFEAAVFCSKIYEFVWGGGVICRQLEKDLAVSIKCWWWV